MIMRYILGKMGVHMQVLMIIGTVARFLSVAYAAQGTATFYDPLMDMQFFCGVRGIFLDDDINLHLQEQYIASGTLLFDTKLTDYLFI